MTINFKISDWLGKNKMTQRELARITGIRPATISALYHDNVKRIEVEHLNKLCAVFNCQPGDLLSYEPGPIDGKLDEPIEMLDLDPVVFNKIRRHYPKVVTVRDLLEKDRSKITGIGPALLATLEDTLNDYQK